MTFVYPNFALATPEIVLLGMSLLAVLFEVFRKNSCQNGVYLLSQLSLLVTAWLVASTMVTSSMTDFNGSFIRDAFGDLLKIFALLLTFATFVFSRDYMIQRGFYKGEYFIMGLIGVLGMMVMISSGNMITLYVGLETLSLAMYAMIAMQRDSLKSTESAMKYFVLGSMASGLLLFGMSMLYGATGTLNFSDIISALQTEQVDKLVLSLGIVFLLTGLVFKLGGAPFHMWLPDVYDGAPTAVTLYLAAAPKLAAFAIFYRVFVDALLPVLDIWQDLVILVVVLSLMVGNLIAIAQTSLKRMLAYSTISHIGFVLMGVAAGNPEGMGGALFYIITYGVMSLGGFGMILLMAHKGFEGDQIKDLVGLNKQHPWFALMFLIIMFSMAGVPPTVGFYAKVLVLQATIDAGLVWLAVFGVVFSIVGAFYYLRIVKSMYFDVLPNQRQITLLPALDVKLMFSGVGLLVLYWGILPGDLINLCLSVIS